jgi:hypothetical protein
VAVVEKWVPNSPQGFKGPLITRDVWNFGDLLACHPAEPGAVLVQTTTAGHLSHRELKVRSIAEAYHWAAAGNSVVLHGWAKRGPRGGKKAWQCVERRLELDLKDYPAANARYEASLAEAGAGAAAPVQLGLAALEPAAAAKKPNKDRVKRKSK